MGPYSPWALGSKDSYSEIMLSSAAILLRVWGGIERDNGTFRPMLSLSCFFRMEISSTWGAQTRDEALVPLSINCWPSVSGGESYVNIEYESLASYDLQNVVIAIPLPAPSHAPRVVQVGNLAYPPPPPPS